MLGLAVASVSAYALSALVLKQPVLTEKMARRGIHLAREYSADPLEVFFAREVMTPHAAGAGAAVSPRVTVYADSTLREVANELARRGGDRQDRAGAGRRGAHPRPAAPRPAGGPAGGGAPGAPAALVLIPAGPRSGRNGREAARTPD